ncbi:FtsX-like permease family protein [Streptomyces sp. NPDC016845]|uniref:FtsX-like permease family protein n=1 Tax=Streptomyces sp. NPDC016845 TaxID=3364972 RepID=UPI0037AC0B05
MLSLALATLRTRWTSLAGCLTALVLGTFLMAASGQVLASTLTSPERGPQRYAAAPTVVVPDTDLEVETARGTSGAPLAEPRSLPASLAGRAAGLPGAVVDRIIPARLASGTTLTGRPWSAHRTAPQRLTAGRAPRTATEIAVSGREGRPGDRVTVVTAAGPATYRIVGTTTSEPGPTVFFTDTRAARLSPRIDALALRQPASSAAVRELVRGTGAHVLTGDDRARTDPARAADTKARNDASTVVGIAGGFAVFVSAFVVSSTFAYATGRRRREFALLRSVGATGRQLRRMVRAEAWLLALVASGLGAVLGPLAAPALLDRLIALGLAPDWTVVSGSAVPALVAFPTGVAVALVAAAAPALRAGRTGPAEALREAAAESRAMTPTRWALGLGSLATALVCMAVNALTDPASATHNKTAMPLVMLLVAAAALLAPAVAAPVARLVAVPLSRLPGAAGEVAASAALASARQTAMTAAPVLVTVGLTAALLGGAATGDAAKEEMRTGPVRAEFVVTARGDGGLDRELMDRLRALPGVDVSAPVPTSVYTLEGDTKLIRRPVEAVDPKALDAAADIPVEAGSLAVLRPGTVVASPTWEHGLGESFPVWGPDGSRSTLKVVGLLGAGATADAYITPGRALTARPPLAYVKLRPGTAPCPVHTALERATRGHSATALTRERWSAEAAEGGRSASRTGLLAVLGVVLAYTVLALVNISLMAAADRTAERRALALLGARRRQVAAFAAMEALLVVTVGALLALGAAALSLAGLWWSVLRLAGPMWPRVPWTAMGTATAVCALLAVVAATVPAALNRRPGT